MMKSALLLAACAAFLGACAAKAPPVLNHPGQAWYASQAAYAVTLDTAREFRRQCLAKPRILQRDCRATVRRLAEIDIQAEEIQEYGDLAASTNDADMLEEATALLDRLKYKMQQEVAAEMEARGEVP